MNAKTGTDERTQGCAAVGPRCQEAVIRAYDNLRVAGVEDQKAFTAATRLFRTHHPETDFKSARLRVAGWIYDRATDG
jgi:hypothetical protein